MSDVRTVSFHMPSVEDGTPCEPSTCGSSENKEEEKNLRHRNHQEGICTS